MCLHRLKFVGSEVKLIIRKLMAQCQLAAHKYNRINRFDSSF